MSGDEQSSEAEANSGEFDLEENIITFVITVFVPFLICFTAFYVIVLAYTGWKLY